MKMFYFLTPDCWGRGGLCMPTLPHIYIFLKQSFSLIRVSPEIRDRKPGHKLGPFLISKGILQLLPNFLYKLINWWLLSIGYCSKPIRIGLLCINQKAIGGCQYKNRSICTSRKNFKLSATCLLLRNLRK